MRDRRPVLVDLFCCAGGAGKGYDLAGFRVVGVDKDPQPNYPYEFHQDDALGWLNRWLDDSSWMPPVAAFHASPPCQHYANVTRWRGDQADHPDLVGPTRDLLRRTGKPYVIENVRNAGLLYPLMLCGSQFGLPIRRHRYFETSWWAFEMVEPCQHRSTDLPFMHKGERAFADAMGCTWMSKTEARQAIPPAYTKWLGRRLLPQADREAAR